jgi:hypothetical protein
MRRCRWSSKMEVEAAKLEGLSVVVRGSNVMAVGTA